MGNLYTFSTFLILMEMFYIFTNNTVLAIHLLHTVFIVLKYFPLILRCFRIFIVRKLNFFIGLFYFLWDDHVISILSMWYITFMTFVVWTILLFQWSQFNHSEWSWCVFEFSFQASCWEFLHSHSPRRLPYSFFFLLCSYLLLDLRQLL